MKKVLLLFAMAAFVTTGFAQKTMVSTNRQLVIYFSETNTTKAVAEELQKQLGADIESIEAVKPYSGNFQETMQRAQRDKEPEIKPLKADLKAYDVIYLGYPIWGGTYAGPVVTLVKKYDFAGKTIVPFCTFGSGGLESSSADLVKALPKAKIKPGYGVRQARVKSAAKELDRFLKENGYKKGSVKPLPEYSAQKAVGDKERKIFDDACSSYQFPLGTPETFGMRTTDDSIDYEFKVKSQGFGGGAPSTSTIYVTMGKEEGAKPEFTRVVR
jgi:flavodoxin